MRISFNIKTKVSRLNFSTLGKNMNMAKTIDLIFLAISVFMLTLVWTNLYLNIGLAITISIVAAFVATFSVIYFKRQKSKPYGTDRLALELSLKGNAYLVEILKSILKNTVFESGSNWILLKNALIIANFRFTPVGLNDVANVYSLAVEKDRKQVFLLCRGVDRKAVHLLETRDIKLNVVKIKGIYNFLMRNSALPDLDKKKNKFSAKEICTSLLARSNMKNYFFSGVVLISVAFFTPYKIYYLIFGSISLVLAILTLTPLGNGEFGTTSAFNALIKETETFTLPGETKNETDENILGNIETTNGESDDKDKN